MGRGAKIHAQPEQDKKQPGHKSPTQPKKTETPSPANLSNEDFRHLSADDIIRLGGVIGNRAVARLMGQRQEDDELEYPGPRTKKLREDTMQQRGGVGRSTESTQRASPHSSATGKIGDAINVDGQALYGWNRTISWRDVATVVNGVVPTVSSEEEMPRVVIFSGTHGNRRGHLVNNAASRGFVAEDQATANAVMAANPGVEVEVIDVVNSYTNKGQLTRVYGMTNYIRVLGWCYSSASHGLGDSIKSNWWPAPDNL